VADEGYRALRASVAARTVDRDVLRVSGPDAASYLQGQVSQDVEGLPVGGSAGSLLLSPQGKVEALIRISRTGDDEYVLDAEGGFGEAVDARLRRFKLRVRAEIEPLPWICVSVRGPEAAAAVVDGPALVLPVSWPGLVGVDLLGPGPSEGVGGTGGTDGAGWVADPVVWCDADSWEAARIEAGIPSMGREIVDGTIAAEVGLVDRTVSFTKGCFTGQELVARLDSRGSKVARSLWGVVVGAGEPATATDPTPPVGAEVFTLDGEHRVGTLSSVAWSPGLGATVALATLHRRVSAPETVSVRWSDRQGDHEVRAESRTLPLVGSA
jgi:folate-binding protein YgfZ